MLRHNNREENLFNIIVTNSAPISLNFYNARNPKAIEITLLFKHLTDWRNNFATISTYFLLFLS